MDIKIPVEYEDTISSESESLLMQLDPNQRQREPSRSLLFYVSVGLNLVLLLVVTGLSGTLHSVQVSSCRDPGLALYSPANTAVDYIDVVHFRAALFNNTPFMGAPTTEKDKLWSDLYNFGISKISKQAALLLSSPTLQIPATDDYLVELDVFHELHCLNDLRKMLWPEFYPNMTMDDLRLDNGSYHRNNDMFRHWDHCVDSIRQALMCHADVAPISFHVNVPASTGIFPRLATAHTCRNFTKVQEWARNHSAGQWKYKFDTAEEAENAIANAGFDQGPLEDIQFLYPLFPGNEYFEYWQTHNVPRM